MFSCGMTDPGTAARASRNSSTSAVRIDVSCRHAHRDSSTGLSAGGDDGGVGGCEEEPPASVWRTSTLMRDASYKDLEAADPGAEVAHPLVPQAGDQHDADQHEHHPAGPGDPQL